MSLNSINAHNNNSSDIFNKTVHSYDKKIKENEFLINELKNIINEKNNACAYYEDKFKIINSHYKKFQTSKEKLHNAINIMKKTLIYYEKKISKLETMNFNKRRKITILKENIKSQDKRILSLIEEINNLQNEVNTLNDKLDKANSKLKDVG